MIFTEADRKWFLAALLSRTYLYTLIYDTVLGGVIEKSAIMSVDVGYAKLAHAKRQAHRSRDSYTWNVVNRRNDDEGISMQHSKANRRSTMTILVSTIDETMIWCALPKIAQNHQPIKHYINIIILKSISHQNAARYDASRQKHMMKQRHRRDAILCSIYIAR